MQYTGDTWISHAACAGWREEHGTERWNQVWFPERGAAHTNRIAKAVCAECPVKRECLDYALANGIHVGIWGGTSEFERRRIRRERHDTAAGRWPTSRLLPCGTYAAYRRHRSNGEEPCATCKEGMKKYSRERKSRQEWEARNKS